MVTIIRPKQDWACSVESNLLFPKLVYRTDSWNEDELRKLCDRDASTETRLSIATRPKDFVLGGSWNLWADEPLYMERCAIFENLYFPYEYNFRHLTVRNAALIWPRINICLYTSTRNPNVVFMVSEPMGNRIIAKFEFKHHAIMLTEYE